LSHLRLPIALGVACAVSLGLFWLLHALIGASGEFESMQAAPKIEFTRLRRDTEVEERKRVKPQIEKPEPPPAAQNVASTDKPSALPGADLAALAPSVDAAGLGGGGIGGIGAAELASAGGSDRDAVPQVRIQPDYPIQARQKRIEGWVDVQFTVGSDGSVRNPIVLQAQPIGIFDRAAIQAVKGWKYNPKIEDGKPVERRDLKVRIRFQLES
jgi:periplasmic protein TonB